MNIPKDKIRAEVCITLEVQVTVGSWDSNERDRGRRIQ